MIATLFAALLAVVNATNSSVSYACNGATAAFAVNYPYLAYTDLVVTSTTAGGTVTTLVYTTDYTVNLTSTTSTATLTLTNPAAKCPTGSTLKIARVVPMTQPTTFKAQTTYKPDLHETSYDRLEMQLQQLAAGVITGLTNFGSIFADSPLLGDGTPGNHLRWNFGVANTWTARQTFTVAAGPAVDAYTTASGSAIHGASSVQGGEGGVFEGLNGGFCYVGVGSSASLTYGTVSGTSAGAFCVGGGLGAGIFEGLSTAPGLYAKGGSPAAGSNGGVGATIFGGTTDPTSDGLAGGFGLQVTGTNGTTSATNGNAGGTGGYGARVVGGTGGGAPPVGGIGGDGGFALYLLPGAGGVGGPSGAAGNGGWITDSTAGAGGAAGVAVGVAGNGGSTRFIGGNGGSASGAGVGGIGGTGVVGQGGNGGATVGGTGGDGASGASNTGGNGAANNGSGGTGTISTGGNGTGVGMNGSGLRAVSGSGGTGTARGWGIEINQTNTLKAHINMNVLAAVPSSLAAGGGDLFVASTGSPARKYIYAGLAESSPVVLGTYTYNAAGTLAVNTHFVADVATLVAGTKTITLVGNAVFASSSSYHCAANEVTNGNGLYVTYTSGSSVAFTSTSGADTAIFHFVCVGN